MIHLVEPARAAHGRPLVPQIVADLTGNQVPRVCLKLHAPVRVEIRHGIHETDVPDLVEVLHRNPRSGIAAGHLMNQGHEERGQASVQLGAADGAVGTKEDDNIIRRSVLPDRMRRSSASHKNAPPFVSPKICAADVRVIGAAEGGETKLLVRQPGRPPGNFTGRARSFAPPSHPRVAVVARTYEILTNLCTTCNMQRTLTNSSSHPPAPYHPAV